MLAHVLWVAHIAVLGYWLGSELVINSTYRYVCRAAAMPPAQRLRLLDHVMVVDQHVRYALVLQFALGFALASLRGYVPGGEAGAWAWLAAGVVWLAYVEFVHRRRHAGGGRLLARFDRSLRYALIGALVVAAVAGLGGRLTLPGWLSWKLGAFAGVLACGVGIRLVLIRFTDAWRAIGEEGSTPAREAAVWQGYVRATSVLVLLWVFIAAAVVLSVLKPA